MYKRILLYQNYNYLNLIFKMMEEEKVERVPFRLFYEFEKVYSWKKEDKIDSGGFATVYKALMNKDGEKTYVAVKKYNAKISNQTRDSIQVKSMFNEARVLMDYPHPLLIKYIDSFIDKEDYAYLVTELAELKDLNYDMHERFKNNQNYCDKEA